jgi:outer membrane protein assembly factor BamB
MSSLHLPLSVGRGRNRRIRTAVGVAVASIVALQVVGSSGAAAVAPGGDWSQYLHDSLHSGFTSETLLNQSNAASLKVETGWPVSFNNGAVCPSSTDYCSSTVAAQPTIATVGGNRLVFVGTWNGSEYALCASSCTVGANSYTTGQVIWSTYVNRTSGCGGPTNSRIAGVTGAAAIGTATINSVMYTVVYVGGGGDIALNGSVIPNATSQLYALDALTGAVLWTTPLGSAPNHYLWSSPVLANGSLYIGIASDDDCPLIQGGVVQIDPNTGQVLHQFFTVPSGCVGASVWGSPTVDAAGNVYVATGNGGSCSQHETYAVAVLKLTSTLGLLNSWAVPLKQQLADGDFGNTPTLFSGTVSPTGTLRSLLGIANKNGIYYVFDTANLAAGPLKQIRVAGGGNDPEKGGGSISPSSWDGTHIYVAGGNTTIGGIKYKGSLREFNPNKLGAGAIWAIGFTGGPVLGAVASDPGLVAVGAGAFSMVVNSANGTVLFTAVASGFYGAPSIAYGVVYEGDTSQVGELHAFSVNGQ